MTTTRTGTASTYVRNEFDSTRPKLKAKPKRKRKMTVTVLPKGRARGVGASRQAWRKPQVAKRYKGSGDRAFLRGDAITRPDENVYRLQAPLLAQYPQLFEEQGHEVRSVR